MRFQDQAEKLALTTCFRIKPDKSSGLGVSEYIPIPFMSWQFRRVTGSISRAALSLFLQEKRVGWQHTATSKKSNTPCVSLVYCLPYLSDESDVNYWISKTQTWQQQLLQTTTVVTGIQRWNDSPERSISRSLTHFRSFTSFQELVPPTTAKITK